MLICYIKLNLRRDRSIKDFDRENDEDTKKQR